MPDKATADWSIERVEEMRIGAERDREIAALLDHAFENDYKGRSFYENRQHCRLLAVLGTRIIGHVGLSFRAVRLGDELMDIIGLGDVAVHSDFRDAGIGTALVEASLDEARTVGVDFAVLFGVRQLYERAGFRSAQNTVIHCEMLGARTKDVVRNENSYLKVCELTSKPWNPDLPLDVAGFAF